MLLVLPGLRRSATKYGIDPVLEVVGSGIHIWTAFPERKEERIFEALADEKKSRMMDRSVIHSLLDILSNRLISFY